MTCVGLSMCHVSYAGGEMFMVSSEHTKCWQILFDRYNTKVRRLRGSHGKHCRPVPASLHTRQLEATPSIIFNNSWYVLLFASTSNTFSTCLARPCSSSHGAHDLHGSHCLALQLTLLRCRLKLCFSYFLRSPWDCSFALQRSPC